MKKQPKAVPAWLNSPLWSSPSAVAADPFGADLSPPPPPPPKPPPMPPPSYEEVVGVGPSSRGTGGRAEEADEDGDGGDELLRAHLLFDFKATLSKKVVNMGELRRLACLGVPDGAGIRPVVWKCAASVGIFAN